MRWTGMGEWVRESHGPTMVVSDGDEAARQDSIVADTRGSTCAAMGRVHRDSRRERQAYHYKLVIINVIIFKHPQLRTILPIAAIAR